MLTLSFTALAPLGLHSTLSATLSSDTQAAAPRHGREQRRLDAIASLEQAEPTLMSEVKAALASDDASCDEKCWSDKYDRMRAHLQKGDNAIYLHNQHAGYFAYIARECSMANGGDNGGQSYVHNDPSTMTAAVNPSGKPTAIKTDAWYCGNTKVGIDWTDLTGEKDKPMADLCHQKLGEVDSPTGICGRYSKRQIIDSFLKVTPLWEKAPDGNLAVNVPGVDCLLGIGEGDVFYCQHCPGLCDGDLVPDGNNATGFAWTF